MVFDSPIDWNEYLSCRGITQITSITEMQNQKNEVVRVHIDGGRELLVKRGTSKTLAGDGSLLAEGLAYKALYELGLSHVAPRCILHDRKQNLLVLDFVPGETVRDAWDEMESQTQPWAALGAFVAEFHCESRNSPEWTSRLLAPFSELIPSAEPVRPSELIVATAAQLNVITAIQLDESVGKRLNDLKSMRNQGLVHGDLRMDNLMREPHGGLRLIDFEYSRTGDQLFDLGTLIGSVIEKIASDESIDTSQRASAVSSTVVNLASSRIRPMIAGYRLALRQFGAEQQPAEDFLHRLSSYVGVHLLHRAGALADHFHAESRLGRVFTIMGCAFLRNPSFFLRPLGMDASYSWMLSDRTKESTL